MNQLAVLGVEWLNGVEIVLGKTDAFFVLQIKEALQKVLGVAIARERCSLWEMKAHICPSGKLLCL